ncbi:EpsG family protein [Brumimicrobium mesophilum]|uniref:EpsG family protein n=1 Tax=Brumimicrobium mesophilum TaxID=392717 RepID=UPI000D1414EA|nr:EpsG family protein [Brumimicrobium mesophilum]
MAKFDKKSFLLMWLVNPMISAIYLFKNFKQNTNIFPYLLLSIFFGISFIVSTAGGDSQAYALELEEYRIKNVTLVELFEGFYSAGSTTIDIYQPLVTWLVSQFTGNSKVLFGVYSLVFGFFLFKSLIIVRSHLNIKLKGLALLVFILLALMNPLWSINGVRMWTAVAAFFYGMVSLHLDKSKASWVYLALPMLIHFSMFMPFAIYLAYRFIPYKNMSVLMALYVVTFFLGELNLDIFKKYFLLLPGFMQSREGYLSDEYVDVINMKAEAKSFFYKTAALALKWSIFGVASLIYFYTIYKNKIKDRFMNEFFHMALIFMSFSNLVQVVPSGGRFLILSNLILLTAFLFFLNKNIWMHPILRSFLKLSTLLVIILRIREGIEHFGIFLFIGSPFTNWFIIDTTLIEVLKSIF